MFCLFTYRYDNRHMDESKKELSSTPPYVAYRTFKNFLATLSAAIPSRIDKSVLIGHSGGTQTQLIHALRYLGLIDAKGAPTDKLPTLVKAEGAVYATALREVLNAAYPFISEVQLRTATQKQLEEAFASVANGDTVRKCLTFYLPAARDAGIALSPFIREVGKRGPATGKPKKLRTVDKAAEQWKPEPLAAATIAPPPALSWHEMLLSKFPSFDPSWPDEVKAKWFENFSQLMTKGTSPMR